MEIKNVHSSHYLITPFKKGESINISNILKKNDELCKKIRKTNNSYESLITLINNFTKLLEEDNELITKIIPTKYDNINSQLCDEYIFIRNFVYSQKFLQNNMELLINRHDYSGKWMLFGTLCEMLKYWKIIKINTYMNKLGYFSKFIGDEKNRVICVYFKDYRNKQNIINYGKIIKEIVNYKLPMYFKTNQMTKKNKYGWGSWKYMIEGDAYEFVN